MSKVEAPPKSVFEALRKRFSAPAFAYLEEVGNATGFACNRHADAVAMSLWPSRGLEVHGIEVKVSRTDWLKELKDPAKADSIARFCDRWWLAVGDDTIVKEGELPPTWGLLVFNAKGGKLVAKVEAAKLDSEPLDRKFVASMLRRASESVVAVRREGFAAGREAGKKDASDPTGATKEIEQLRESLAAFEEKSGLKIDGWSGGYLGEAVNKLMALRHGRVEPSSEIDLAVAALERAAKRLREEKAAMGKAIKLAQGAA